MRVLSFPSAYRQGETPYSIFKDRMNAIGSIASGIKNMIANKYVNNQMNMIADNILNKVDEVKSTELINTITGKPPEEIYPDNLEGTVGQFYDFVTASGQTGSMGSMAQKETMMGGLATGASVGAPTEARIPKADISQLYSAVKGMPSREVNWANLYKDMSANKPYFMGATSPEEMVAQKMMGQVQDPRAKLESDVKLAKLMQETFYPEEAEKQMKYISTPYGILDKTTGELKEIEKQTEGVMKYTSTPYGILDKITGEVMKIEKIEEDNPNYQIVKVTDKEGNINSFYVNKDNPSAPAIPVQGLPSGKTGTTTTDDKVTTGEISLADRAFKGVRTIEQYNIAKAKVRQTDKNVIIPELTKVLKDTYNNAMADIVFITRDGKIEKGANADGYSYETLYNQAYNEIEQAIKEYRQTTGETLENPFISLEEYKKDVKPDTINPLTWGHQQKSIFKNDNIYKDGDIEVIGGKTLKYDAGRDAWEELGSL